MSLARKPWTDDEITELFKMTDNKAVEILWVEHWSLVSKAIKTRTAGACALYYYKRKGQQEVSNSSRGRKQRTNIKGPIRTASGPSIPSLPVQSNIILRNLINNQRAWLESIEQAEKELIASLIRLQQTKDAERDKLHQMETNISLRSDSYKDAIRAFRTDLRVIQDRFCDCLDSMENLKHRGETLSRKTRKRKVRMWFGSRVKELSEVLEENGFGP